MLRKLLFVHVKAHCFGKICLRALLQLGSLSVLSLIEQQSQQASQGSAPGFQMESRKQFGHQCDRGGCLSGVLARNLANKSQVLKRDQRQASCGNEAGKLATHP